MIDVFFYDISYWAWFGTINLFLMTYQDIKHKMNIDDRNNYFMMGVTLSLISHLPISIWYLLGLLGITMLYVVLGTRYIKAMGGADFTTFGWIMYGYGIISPYKLFFFMVSFTVITLLYLAAKYGYCKLAKLDTNVKTPFYPVILIAFVFNTWLFGLY